MNLPPHNCQPYLARTQSVSRASSSALVVGVGTQYGCHPGWERIECHQQRSCSIVITAGFSKVQNKLLLMPLQMYQYAMWNLDTAQTPQATFWQSKKCKHASSLVGTWKDEWEVASSPSLSDSWVLPTMAQSVLKYSTGSLPALAINGLLPSLWVDQFKGPTLYFLWTIPV